jgi:hypothetical protein
LGTGVSESTIIPDILVTPDIRSDTENTLLPGESHGVGFAHLGNEDKHDKGTSIEVPDGQFSQQEISSHISESNLMNGPFPIGGVVIFATIILLNEAFSVVGGDVLQGADLLGGFFAERQDEFLFGALEDRGVIIVIDVVAFELDRGHHFVIVLIKLFLGSEPQSCLGLSDWH